MSVTNVRETARDRAMNLVDGGVIKAETMLLACLKYMSLDEVEDMLDVNCFEEELDYE